MKFKKFLESQTVTGNEHEKIVKQILLLRIDLKNAKTNGEAQKIQQKINTLLAKQEKMKLSKDTEDNLTVTKKTK